MGDRSEQPSLAPEWLSFHKELPLSAQDKAPKPVNDRDRPRRFSKQNSYHHLNHVSPPQHSHPHPPPSSSPNWRHSDANPRILNRSKSSPVFELKDVADAAKAPKSPKSPDRSNISNSSDRSFAFMRNGGKPHNKFKPKPPLMSSMSSPNLNLLFAGDKGSWRDPKSGPPTRSPPSVTRSASSINISLPVAPAPVVPVVTIPVPQPPPPTPLTTPSSLSHLPEDLEIEKLRILVPSASVVTTPKPAKLVEPGNRKGAHPKVNERPKKVNPPTAAQLKKATSETSLLSTEELARRARSIKADKTKVKLMEIVEDKGKVMARRNNFFMDVIKREQQLQDGAEELVNSGGSIGSDETNESDTNDVKLEDVEEENENDMEAEVARCQMADVTPPLSFDAAEHRKSPPVEDEERFLRELGWVPEEEDHVPELEEEEIAEVRLKINGHQGSPVSPVRAHRFDVDRNLAVSIHQE